MRDVKMFVDYLVYGVLEGDANVDASGKISNSDVTIDKALPNELYDLLYQRTSIFFETYTSSLKDDIEAVREYMVEQSAKDAKAKEYQDYLLKLMI